MKRLSYILLVVCTLMACRPGVPSDVLSESDMVDILYDMHIAQTMSEMPDVMSNSKDVVTLRSAILKKYDVTPEEFERSYLFYCSHTEHMYEIYQKISERVKENVIAAGGKIQGIETDEADTANVWNQEPYAILMDQAPYNKVQFSVVPDSTFQLGDRINLQYDAQMIQQEGSCHVVACMNLIYPNDSIFSKVSSITSNGSGVLSLNSNDQTPLSKITGHFFLTKISEDENANGKVKNPFRLVVLRNIKLLHLHEQGTRTTQEEEPSADQE